MRKRIDAEPENPAVMILIVVVVFVVGMWVCNSIGADAQPALSIVHSGG